MSTTTDSTLPTLLASSPFLLAYTIPLLIISFVVCFAGTFLTLDRSRTFAPRYDAIPGSYQTKKKGLLGRRWMLEGGLGGLCVGFLFGVHLVTFLSLLIPSKSSSSPLSAAAFLATWLLSSTLTTFLAGRFRYAALTLSALSGGPLFSLSFCILIHPPLLARQIFPAIITPLLLLACLLPIERGHAQHWAMRFATASTGAFGIVLSIALLAGSKYRSWADAWERWWSDDATEWGTNQEKGFDAAWVAVLCLGMVVDWALRRWVGECPDEKWDSFLASYTSGNLPDRAGNFQPFVSVWDRMLGKGSSSNSKSKKDILFPIHRSSSGKGDTEFKLPSLRSGKDDPFDSDSDAERDRDLERGEGGDEAFRPMPGYLKKSRSNAFGGGFGEKKRRDPVKFQPLSEMEMLTSSDEEDGSDLLKTPVPQRPWLRPQPSSVSTAATLVEDTYGLSPSPSTPTTLSKAQKKKKTKPQDRSKGFAALAKEEAEENSVEIDYDGDLKKLGAKFKDGEAPEYSDYDSDAVKSPKSPKAKAVETVTAAAKDGKSTPVKGKKESTAANADKDKDKDKEWSPGFLKNRSRSSQPSSSSSTPSSARTKRVTSGESNATSTTLLDGSTSSPTIPPAFASASSASVQLPKGAVPATPSLIKAIDRIKVAQKDAFGLGLEAVTESPGGSSISSSPERPSSAVGGGGIGVPVKERAKRFTVETKPQPQTKTQAQAQAQTKTKTRGGTLTPSSPSSSSPAAPQLNPTKPSSSPSTKPSTTGTSSPKTHTRNPPKSPTATTPKSPSSSRDEYGGKSTREGGWDAFWKDVHDANVASGGDGGKGGRRGR